MIARRLLLNSLGMTFGLLMLLCSNTAFAHKPSDSYLGLSHDAADAVTIRGQWDIALRDLDFALGLDTDDDGVITWGELRQQQSAIYGYALARLGIGHRDETCPLTPDDMLVDHHSDGTYAVILFTARCTKPIQELDLSYRLFFDLDRQHRGLLKLQTRNSTESLPITVSAIFSPDATNRSFALGSHADKGRWQYFGDYVVQGVWHIWIGIDHILFLVSLLLPAVMVWHMRRWLPVTAFRPALWEVVRIVTAFTVAHSITLTAATLGWVSLPSRLVESVIALSVVLAALNNLVPRVARARWLVAFVFGLIHGFGFASVLADLGLPESALVIALLGFNVGVELGQLAIVAIVLPASFAIRQTPFYRLFVLGGGSVLIVLVAGAWFVERAFNLKFMPF